MIICYGCRVLDPTLFQDLESRGLIRQVTDSELVTTLTREPMTVYAGFDPTADSLHVGHMLPLLTLRRFQLAGHRVIALAGGATGMVGDPSEKTNERSLLTEELISKNLEGITAVISRFLDLSGPNPALILNNADWFGKFSYLGFLRDIGKHFTVNHMLGKESIRARLEDREHGISYTEFSYMLMQAYDFYFLNQKHQCRLQIGGSDQWGNITAGTELIRRMNTATSNTTVFGLTQPLITKSDGTKFGKTEQGAVWLDAQKTSVYQFYQFFIQTPDSDTIAYLKKFTFLPLSEISRLEDLLKTEPEKRAAQKTLASEMTKLVHGASELSRVEKASRSLFGAEIRTLDAQTLLEIFAGAPSLEKPRSTLIGSELLELIVESGLLTSKGNARKEITAGGVYLNNERVTDIGYKIGTQDLIADRYIALRRGKKNYCLLKC